MSFPDPDVERILKYYYDSKDFIGINDVRDYFHLTDDHIHDIHNDLENSGFIYTSLGSSEGTMSPYAPKGFGPGKLFQITKKGIEYIEKQGQFNKTESNTYNRTITNSPNVQIMAGSPNSQQNTSDSNSNLDQFLLKLEDLNTQIDEFQKELSQIQQNITQTILQRDKNVIEKFLSSKTFKFLPPELKVNLTLDKLLDYFKNLFSA